MKRLILTAGLFLAAVAPRADAQQGDTIKVPFDQIKSQHIVVEVKINGKGPYRLIFDTGAPYSLLSAKIGRECGIVPEGKSAFGQFKVKSIEIGAAKVEDATAMVMDHPTIKAIGKHVGPVEGLVGLSFFGRYKMTIDYQKKEMTFAPGTFDPGDILGKIMTGLGGAGKDKKAAVLAPAGHWGFRVAKEVKDDEAGVDVKDVLPDSPAAAAGLKTGDRLLTLDGRWTDSVNDCYQAAGLVRPGASATLLVRRGGKEIELTVKVASGL